MDGLRIAFAQPLYSQVRAQVLKRVSAGEWAAGEALPNEFSLASEYRISVGTVRRAVEGLEKQGILVRKQGRGTFVAGNGRTPLQDKFTMVRGVQGRRAPIEHRIESVQRRPASAEEAACLACKMTAEVLHIEQTVTLGDQVAGVERSIVSVDLFPKLETQLTYGQHLYPVFNLYGFLVTRASEIVSLVEANEKLSRLIGVEIRQPLLKIERTAFTHSEQPIEYRVSHYDPARASYAATIV